MVRLLEELAELEKLSLIDISYSRIETFMGEWGCPAKYFFQYVQKLGSAQGDAALLGNVLHSTLEEKLEPNQEPILDVLLEEFENQKVAWDTESILTEELINAGRDMLVEFVSRHQGETFPIEAKEKEFAIVVGSGLIRGYIDRIDIRDNLVKITDYKSGKREVTAKGAPNNLQLGIYALAASKLYPGKDVYAQLYYLRSGRQKGHLFSKGDLEEVECRLKKIVHQIVNTMDFTPTSEARICRYCDYASQGVCGTGVRIIRNRR